MSVMVKNKKKYKAKSRERHLIAAVITMLGGSTAVAKKLGTTFSTVNNWQQEGRVSLTWLHRFCEEFDIPAPVVSDHAWKIGGAKWSWEQRVANSKLPKTMRASLTKWGKDE